LPDGWLILRFVVRGFYTVGPNERAVITTFGRAQRVGTATTLDDPIAQTLRPEGQKVVNRLRQVTAAIEQDGVNRVNVIRSASEREAAIEFAKAAALRPRIVGEALARIAEDPEISHALFEVLEAQNVLRSPDLRVTLVPPGSTILVDPAQSS